VEKDSQIKIRRTHVKIRVRNRRC